MLKIHKMTLPEIENILVNSWTISPYSNWVGFETSSFLWHLLVVKSWNLKIHLQLYRFFALLYVLYEFDKFLACRIYLWKTRYIVDQPNIIVNGTNWPIFRSFGKNFRYICLILKIFFHWLHRLASSQNYLYLFVNM